MDPALAADLTAICAAVQIISPDAVYWAGQPVAPQPAPPGTHPLLAGLAARLYQDAFCHRFTGTVAPPPPAAPPDAAFLQALRAAHGGQTQEQSGWLVVGPGPDGRTLLEQDGLVRAAWPGEFLLADAMNGPPPPGAPARLRLPHESTTLQPGAYFAFGATPADSVADSRLVRFYWHLRAWGAPRLLTALRAQLDHFAVPYRCKCWANPLYYARRDGAILYVPRRHYGLVAELLGRVYRAVQGALVADTPLFTRRLAPGLALADDPGPAESFGQQRCRLVAEGLWQAASAGATTPAARLAAISERFALAGISLARPHLNPGAADDYPWPPYRE